MFISVIESPLYFGTSHAIFNELEEWPVCMDSFTILTLGLRKYEQKLSIFSVHINKAKL